jgi:serine/threonine protein kinase
MGQVHLARHRSGRLVAIKRVRNTYSTDRELSERLVREARMLNNVSHPNVVRFLNDGMDEDGKPYLVMDRAPGTALDALIKREGRLPVHRVVTIASQLLAGVAAIHDAQIVHADLKSSNILVDEIDLLTIIDFGLARRVSAPTELDAIAGTPAYMAPEVISGKPASQSSDIYALGVIIYEMLTGATPFVGQLATILTQQLTDPVIPPSLRVPDAGIPYALDAVILRSLDAMPNKRFKTVRAFAAALDEALGTDLVAGAPTLQQVVPDDRRPTVEMAVPAAPTEVIVVPAPTKRVKARTKTSEEDAKATNRIPRIAIGIPTRRIESTDALIAESLARAESSMAEGRANDALIELEQTLAELAADATVDAELPPDVWRIERLRATIYERLEKHDTARRVALVAYRHALRSGSPTAELQTKELVERVLNRPANVPLPGRRMAKGSNVKELHPQPRPLGAPGSRVPRKRR